MTQKKEDVEEEFVFEFYDEDYAESLDDVEAPKLTEEYNEVDFEADLNEEQLEIVNSIQGQERVLEFFLYFFSIVFHFHRFFASSWYF